MSDFSDVQVIAGHSDVLAVEVAAVEALLRFVEEQRVVVAGVELFFDDSAAEVQRARLLTSLRRIRHESPGP